MIVVLPTGTQRDALTLRALQAAYQTKLDRGHPDALRLIVACAPT